MNSRLWQLAPLFTLVLAGAPALADPGHLAEERGHAHWIALAALAAAVLVGIVGYARGVAARRRRDAPAKPL